jgi:hypothetical protein
VQNSFTAKSCALCWPCFIALTEQGLMLAQQAWQVQERVIHVMMASLSDAQIEDLQQFSVRAHKDLRSLQADSEISS